MPSVPEVEPTVEPKVETKAQPKSEPKSPEEPSAAKERAPVVAEPAKDIAVEPAKEIAVEPAKNIVVEPAATSRIEPTTAPIGEVAQIDALESARSALTAEKSAHDAKLFSVSGAVSAVRGESLLLDGATIPRVSAADTSMSVGALRDVIHQWRFYIERNPLDPKNDQGYVQVANAYYLLARLTRNDAIISQGARLVQEYADRVNDPDLKKLLLDSKARIESFRGK